MNTMKPRSSTAWEELFTPKWYGVITGSGTPSVWNELTGRVKVHTSGSFEIFWPPGDMGPIFSSLPADFTASTIVENAAAWAGVRFNPYGLVEERTSILAYSGKGDWASHKISLTGSEWEIYCAPRSGSDTLAGAAVDMWLDLDVDRSWTLTQIAKTYGSKNAVLDIEVRNKLDTSNSDTIVVSIEAVNNEP